MKDPPPLLEARKVNRALKFMRDILSEKKAKFDREKLLNHCFFLEAACDIPEYVQSLAERGWTSFSDC